MSTTEIRKTEYTCGGKTFEGLFLTQSDVRQCPTILVCHGWEGRIDNLTQVAERLLPWGYQAFVVDLYGKGITGDSAAECESLMQPLMDDRQLLADRLYAVVSAVSEISEVDSKQLGAIGFCFGGLCVLDLARIGSPLRGVASFHGVFAPTTVPLNGPIDCKVAIYHGWDDPLAPPADVVLIGNELTEANVDWQLHAFGQTMHAFMSKDANSPELGIQANPRSAARAWHALEYFLTECFSTDQSLG